MKTLLTTLATLALASCAGIPVPGGGALKTTVGYYAPTPPPEGKLGAFTEHLPGAVLDPTPK